MARLLIADDSPMHARHDIDGMQASQLDAIAFCANAIDFLYRRLLHGLHEAGTEHFHQADHTLPDAWAMVDWIYRLDGLVDRCRGFPKESPAKVDYRNSSSLVENQRHAIQHLTGTIPELVESGRSPWGHLCWILAMRPTE